MIDGIPLDSLLTGGGVLSLLIGLYWLLATGRLVTRREVDVAEKARERELADIKADRDVWRDNFLDQKGLMSHVLEGQETTNRLLRAIPLVGGDDT